MSADVIQKLQKLGALLEAKDLHEFSGRIPHFIREINAAPARESGVEISDWNSFLDWWGKNRGQNLKYVFIDTFGEKSEEVQQVSDLITAADKHEADLHAFYMLLRSKAKEQAKAPQKEEEAPVLKQEPEEAPEPEPEEEKEEPKIDLDSTE